LLRALTRSEKLSWPGVVSSPRLTTRPLTVNTVPGFSAFGGELIDATVRRASAAGANPSTSRAASRTR
jgi:hypothetical protein